MEEVTTQMPVFLNQELIHAVRNHDLTKCDDRDEMNKRIGWLICAYEVMVDARLQKNGCDSSMFLPYRSSVK